ncbi:unnamed protein product [Medioppia subpectinata]|uniref:Non-structural maintenance of chromosomes element 1 homolog n=1 Tax=Medioppia subpectinata TaxID=1979941 RepID=A0A7R9KUZ5_9ACAR|nr:unnamed protein product [Medioppia subpectinata]CAG2110206.1 unnamed protein product [Medioppia subpectinata]
MSSESDNTTKYLIQSLMWRQCVSEDNLKRLVTKCKRGEEAATEASNELVAEVVTRVNRQMRAYNISVSRGPNESDGTIYYALINTADNDITRMANSWSQKELLYFRKLMAAIIENKNSCIASTKMLNIGREDDIKFSLPVSETLTNKWVEQKWFEDVSDGKIAIGIRTLLEMSVYIRERFEVQDCFRCKILCIRGLNCMSCDTKLHYHCSDVQFIPDNKCPNCAKQFASTTTQNTNQSDSDSVANDSTQGVNGSAHNHRIDDSTDEETVEDLNEAIVGDSDEEPIQRRRSGRSKRSRLS